MKYLINLFPERSKSLSENIVYFGFHYLRYILVITQFVAICVFFFRFKVDQEIVDLKDTLYQKQSIVTSTADLIARVQEIDSKMKSISLIIDEQKIFQTRYSYIISSIPSQVTISTFSLSSDAIEITGNARTVEPIKSFYDGLIRENRFGTIDLSNIEKASDEFIFSLHLAEFKK